MTPGIKIKLGEISFHSAPTRSLRARLALSWADPAATTDCAFSWDRFKLIEFSSFP